MVRTIRSLKGWLRNFQTELPRRSGDQVCLFTKRPILHQDANEQSLLRAIDELQTLLKSKGYPRGGSLALTREFDRDTEAAVKEFQTEHGLNADGIVGPLTWACLYYPQLSRRTANKSPDLQPVIRELQTILKEEKFLYREPDGYFGKITERAVKRFQRVYGLKSDGVVGAWTWTVLLGVRQNTEEGLTGIAYLQLNLDWLFWEPLIMILCILLGIYWSPIPGDEPAWSIAFVTAYGFTCVIPLLEDLLKVDLSGREDLPLLQFAPYVLCGILWKPILNLLVERLQN